jgi:predicted transglutaminase-like cysteine proteinase
MQSAIVIKRLKTVLYITWLVLKWIPKRAFCFVWTHNWTCQAAEGIPLTEAQKKGTEEGFYEYTKMYCKRCGTESEASKRARMMDQLMRKIKEASKHE